MTPRKNTHLRLVFALSFMTTTLCGQQSPPNTVAMPSQVKAVLSKPLPQTKVTDCVEASSGLTWQNSTKLSYSSEGLALKGLDAMGRPWGTTVPASGVLTCEVWRAKLTRQANEDLMIINYGHSSDGFDAELTILTFDAEGRPVPWQAIGKFESSPAGIAQITSAGSGSDAAVVVSTRSGDRRDGFAYIYSLYEATSNGF